MCKTTFHTHYRHYEFVVLSFGLPNAPTTFMSLMHGIFQPQLDKFVLIFTDDILIHSKNQEQHQEHLKTILQTLRENQLYTKFSKCNFFKDQIQYMGHVISKDSISIHPKKVKTMMEWIEPKNVVDIISLLGLVGYYRMFTEGFSKITFPMTSIQNKWCAFQWTVEHQQIFLRLKHILTTTLVLKVVDPEKSFMVCTNASKDDDGGELTQEEKVITDQSRKLKDYEQSYSSYDVELSVVVHALKMWQHYLLGKKFLLLTDHSSLIIFFDHLSLNAPQDRWIEFLSEFDFKIKHLRGKENFVADALRTKVHCVYEIQMSQVNSNIPDIVKEISNRDPE